MCLRTKLSGRVRTVWGRIIGTGSGPDASAIDIVIQYLMLSIGSKKTWRRSPHNCHMVLCGLISRFCMVSCVHVKNLKLMYQIEIEGSGFNSQFGQ